MESIVLLLKDLDQIMNMFCQENDSVLKIGFAILKFAQIHRAYLVFVQYLSSETVLTPTTYYLWIVPKMQKIISKILKC